MATAQPSELDCPVCTEMFTTPKILPCAHLLCRHCLIQRMGSQTDAQCPLCRDPIVDAQTRRSKSLDDIADSLPTDLAMEARVECSAILSKQHVCGGCRNSPATSICLNCGDMLCGSCTNVHKNMSATRHHESENMTSLTPERLASIRRPVCPVHTDRPSELYCPTHGAAICHLCATAKHRACPKVMELEDKMEQARKLLAGLAVTLKAGESKMEEEISKLDQYLKQIEKATQAALNDIDQNCNHLQSSVEKCRSRMKDLIKGANKAAKDAVQNRKTSFIRLRGKVTSHQRLVESTSQTLPRACVIADTASSLERRVNVLDFDVELIKYEEIIKMATLQIDKTAVERVKQELSRLGQLLHVNLGPQNTSWRFHRHHGKHIQLSNDRRTAKHVWECGDGVVLSSEPLKTGILYEMRVDEISGDTEVYCGVTDQDPANLTLPSYLPMDWESAVVITSDSVADHGRQAETGVGKKLCDCRAGSRVGLLVDANSCLHFFFDGQDQGVAARHVMQPCYAFFELYGRAKKITTLPLRRIL